MSVSFHKLDPDQRADAIEVLRGSSVQAVELWGGTFEMGDEFVQEARRAFDSVGVRPRTVHADFDPSLDISSLDASIRSAGIDGFATALDLAARIGASIVVMHPSSEPIADEERGSRIRQAKRSIGTVVSMAREKHCQVAFELLPRTCLGNSAAELLALLDGVDPAAAGVCLDVNHLMGRHASLPDVVLSLGPRLIALHCSDYDGVDEKHWPPMHGVVDWAAFLSALSTIGFTGPLNYESHLDGDTPAARLAFLEANYAQLMAMAPR